MITQLHIINISEILNTHKKGMNCGMLDDLERTSKASFISDNIIFKIAVL